MFKILKKEWQYHVNEWRKIADAIPPYPPKATSDEEEKELNALKTMARQGLPISRRQRAQSILRERGESW